MKPKELRRRALKIIEKVEDECPKPEAFRLLLTAEQLLVAAEEIEGAGDTIKPEINGKRVGGEPPNEAEHFYVCPACGQAVDMRDLGAVLHHERKGHEPL